MLTIDRITPIEPHMPFTTSEPEAGKRIPGQPQAAKRGFYRPEAGIKRFRPECGLKRFRPECGLKRFRPECTRRHR